MELSDSQKAYVKLSTALDDLVNKREAGRDKEAWDQLSTLPDGAAWCALILEAVKDGLEPDQIQVAFFQKYGRTGDVYRAARHATRMTRGE